MTDRDVVERFAAIVAVGTVHAGTYRWRGEQRPLWTWGTHNFEHVQYVLGLFWGYLGERRKNKAKEALFVLAQRWAHWHPGICRRGHSTAGANGYEYVRKGGRKYRACRKCLTDYRIRYNAKRRKVAV